MSEQSDAIFDQLVGFAHSGDGSPPGARLKEGAPGATLDYMKVCNVTTRTLPLLIPCYTCFVLPPSYWLRLTCSTP